jgi:septal ring factor EnvC (AmiA/AmiB activator)
MEDQRKQLHILRVEQSRGWDLDDEAYEQLLVTRAETDKLYEAVSAELRRLRLEQIKADDTLHSARDAAAEARWDVEAEEARMARARQAAAEAEQWEAEQREAAEEERLKRHRELMAFYDTMSPQELQRYLQVRACVRNEELFKDSPLSQPIAPGPPRVYHLCGDPSTWDLPSPPPSPPPLPP